MILAIPIAKYLQVPVVNARKERNVTNLLNQLYGDYDFDIYDDDHISLDPLDDDIAAAYDDIEDGISWTEDASTDFTTSC